ncbi:unnamed protein product [Symbiodinium natans]|uniref:PUB domain-containing protein n=1 Tax=Symbiodinium natans TaxID=878477 RepID=A0A812SMF2_9DINO|nr:unnamed protein product [Symbiodinium natans]
MAVEDLEKLLRALPAEGALRGLEVLETLVRNVVRAPEEEKFRRLRTSNEKLAPLLNLPGARAVMECMGWEAADEFLVLPMNVELDFPNHVSKILDAKSHFLLRDQTEKRVAKIAQAPAQRESELAEVRALQKQKYQDGGSPSEPYEEYRPFEEPKPDASLCEGCASWCCCCSWLGGSWTSPARKPKMRTLDDIPRQMDMSDVSAGLQVARLLGGG